MKSESRQTGVALAKLLVGTGIIIPAAGHDLLISGIVADSRQAGPGMLFVAVKGETVDGHDFLAAAVKSGCAAVVVEGKPDDDTSCSLGVPVLVAEDGRRAVAELAANFYGHPEQEMKLIGITGTNGKTTTSYILESMVKAGGGNPGVIGTISYRYGGREEEAPFTTPEPIMLYRMMREMVDQKVDHLIMEVSSHALVQKRLFGIKFDLAVFTNLSHEHLDFHIDMYHYFEAKSRLFSEYLKNDGVAVVMLSEIKESNETDIGWGDKLVDDLFATGRFRKYNDSGEEKGNLLLTCGVKRGDIYVESAVVSLDGTRAEIVGLGDDVNFESRLVGDFNLLNMATAMGVGKVLGLSDRQMARGFGETETVPGRLERVREESGGDFAGMCRVFVDYAHTPDALSGVLLSVKPLCRGRLLVVFGCGGDRDRVKRPLMGEIAGKLSDVAIITSDNSRSEEPQLIMAEIERGLLSAAGPLPRSRVSDLLASGGRGYDIIEARDEAIAAAIEAAAPEDVVLICGKGHENYQLVGGQKHFFDDRLEARKFLRMKLGQGC